MRACNFFFCVLQEFLYSISYSIGRPVVRAPVCKCLTSIDSGAHPLHKTMLDQRVFAVHWSDHCLLVVVIHPRASVNEQRYCTSSVRKSTKNLLNEALLAFRR